MTKVNYRGHDEKSSAFHAISRRHYFAHEIHLQQMPQLPLPDHFCNVTSSVQNSDNLERGWETAIDN
jgi:hypothetical protein